MPLTLTEGSGLPDANSYATLSEANAAIDYALGAEDWGELTDDDKMRYLVAATEMIDALPCVYERADASQALLYPIAKPISGTTKILGYAEAKKACIKQALHLSKTYEIFTSAENDSIEALKNKNLGGVYMEKLSAGVNPFHKYDGSLFRLLAPYLRMDFNKISRG